MPRRDIVVIGASAGGVEALQQLLADLPPDPPAALFVVVHTSPESTNLLPDILRRVSPANIISPKDEEVIRSGNVYIAPPDLHMVLQDGHVRLLRGPRENRSRPAIDVLFRSAAQAYGPRVIGVVLTGYLDDGAAGLVAIKRAGGLGVVQDPSDSVAPAMPENALAEDSPDHVVPLSKIAPLLMKLMDRNNVRKKKVAGRIPTSDVLVALTCPECGGRIFENASGKLLQYHCMVGHRYSPENMAEAQDVAVEQAMWAAYRALEETIKLSERLAAHARHTGRTGMEKRFRERAKESQEYARTLRGLFGNGAARKVQTIRTQAKSQAPERRKAG